MNIWTRILLAAAAGALFAACNNITSREAGWPPPVQQITSAPVYAPEDALKTFVVPPGFRVELVASEPLIENPIAVDIDADGRIWVVEMRSFMSDLVKSEGDFEPISRISVLEDTNGDGRMDRSTVFLDSLVLPRAVLAIKGGALVAEPPHLWFARDTTGDLKADEKIVVRDDYGDPAGNQQAMGNGLIRGLDNWIHSTSYTGRLRPTDAGFDYEPTLALGQFGLSMDNYGRFYRNWNSSPLHVALIDAHYYARNPRMIGVGAADVLAGDDAKEVWPIRNTPGANRGYRPGELREDGTLRTYTSASGTGVYRGHRYPESFQGDVFVAEPVGNLVRRYKIIEHEDGTMTAVNAYDRAEFMASLDERFRPVNFFSAPDGTMYVVDMYNGVIEHRRFLTQYLKDQITQRGLADPRGLGRIYRVVYDPDPPDERRPRLSSVSNLELIDLLSHPNGWWRDRAQQLLIDRRATEVLPALTQLASAENELTRLHALWTMEGLGILEADHVLRALSDQSPKIRAAAVRLSERWLREGSEQVLARVTALVEDASPEVRLQLAASLGEAPPPTADDALAALLLRAGEQPYLTATMISGLGGREVAFMADLLRRDGERFEDALKSLASTVVNGGDMGHIDRMLRLIGDETGTARAHRLAVLSGIEARIPGSGRPLLLREEPASLHQIARSSDPTVRAQAEQISERIVWPGKPGYEAPRGMLLTDEARQRFEEGQRFYIQACASCHGPNGEGQQGVATSLVGSEWVLGPPLWPARIVLDGKEGAELMMPPHRNELDDRQIAAIVTYIRNAWGNHGSVVTPSAIADVRAETSVRGRPWTAEELRVMFH